MQELSDVARNMFEDIRKGHEALFSEEMEYLPPQQYLQRIGSYRTFLHDKMAEITGHSDLSSDERGILASFIEQTCRFWYTMSLHEGQRNARDMSVYSFKED